MWSAGIGLKEKVMDPKLYFALNSTSVISWEMNNYLSQLLSSKVGVSCWFGLDFGLTFMSEQLFQEMENISLKWREMGKRHFKGEKRAWVSPPNRDIYSSSLFLKIENGILSHLGPLKILAKLAYLENCLCIWSWNMFPLRLYINTNISWFCYKKTRYI